MWPETREKADLELELVSHLLEESRGLLDKVRISEPGSVELMALSAMLHSFYGGIENVFKRIALDIDDSLPSGSRWHSDLVQQMSRAGIGRGPVISNDLCERLGEYLTFRHVFRHSYTFDLRWEKMSGLVLGCRETFDRLREELRAFFDVAEH